MIKKVDSITKRLFFSYLTLLALFLLFSLITSIYILNKEANVIIETATKDITTILKDDVELFLISEGKSYAKEIKNILDSYPYILGITIYNRNFQEIFSYQKKEYQVIKFKNFKEKNRKQYTDKKLGKIYSFIFPVQIPSFPNFELRLLGYFQLDLHYNYFLEPQKHLFLIETAAYMMFLVIAALLSFYFSSIIINPLKNLVICVNRIKERKFDTKIEEKTGLKELDNLIETFNEMTEELKHYHDKLNESYEKLRIVAEFTVDWEYWQAPDGSFIYISPSCEEITGYSISKFKEDPSLYEKIIYPEDLPIWKEHYKVAHLNLEEHSEIEFRIITADGKIKWISHVCYPVYSEDGKFLGIRGSNRDITDRKELEAQILQAQKMESIARLAGGVAHDINNLMAAIIGQTELICLLSGEESKQCQRAKKIMTIAQKASALGEQLLNYAKGGKFYPEIIDLNEIIKETINLQESSIPPQIKLEYNLDENLWPIYGDKHQISQVIMNLILNAAEAINDQGKIKIETKNIELKKKKEEIIPGKYIYLRIEDTGSGMNEETLERIFEPFFSTKEFGRGLGLAAVFGIIKNHQGYIKVKSKVNQGTIFEIYFPAYVAENTSKAKNTP